MCHEAVTIEYGQSPAAPSEASATGSFAHSAASIAAKCAIEPIG
jgi:hypothetical protein